MHVIVTYCTLTYRHDSKVNIYIPLGTFSWSFINKPIKLPLLSQWGGCCIMSAELSECYVSAVSSGDASLLCTAAVGNTHLASWGHRGCSICLQCHLRIYLCLGWVDWMGLFSVCALCRLFVNCLCNLFVLNINLHVSPQGELSISESENVSSRKTKKTSHADACVDPGYGHSSSQHWENGGSAFVSV